MTENKNKLEVSYGGHLVNKFNSHLKKDHNSNILFSVEYGIGKSTFLQQYFKNSKEYYTITLIPVNYAVNSNENIFELIKVDIIKQLYLDGHIDFNKQEETVNKRSCVSVRGF